MRVSFFAGAGTEPKSSFVANQAALGACKKSEVLFSLYAKSIKMGAKFRYDHCLGKLLELVKA